VGNHTRPQEASAIAAVSTDPPVSVPSHPEDRAFEDGVAKDAGVTPAVQPIPQTVLLQAGTKLELGHEDAANTIGDGQHSESDGTDEEKEDEGDDDGDGDEEEEEEEEEGEDEDEEEDDEEDEEPALKYERFGGAFQDLLKKDSASALAVSNKFLALGSHNGFAHILDLTGKRIKTFKPHTASVVDMCFDTTADFIGTASMDGEHLSPSSLSLPDDSN